MGSPEKEKRNAEIVMHRLVGGRTVADIADEYRISHVRVLQILERHERRLNSKKNLRGAGKRGRKLGKRKPRSAATAA